MRLYAFRKSLFVFFNFGKLATVLIDIMENEPQLVAGLDKKDEVLSFLKKHKDGLISLDFLEMWLDKSEPKPVFNFNGALIPQLKSDDLLTFIYTYLDTFLFSMFFDDNNCSSLVKRLDGLMIEGPYGYTDKKENFDVSLKAGDTAIDAGAWIGDFSAYAAALKAKVYAFEPTSEIFKTLQEVADLNNMLMGEEGEQIFPIKAGLGASDSELELFISSNFNSSSNTIIKGRIETANDISEKIQITSLDNFANKQNLKKIDFIKADIEGAERDMLKGAKNVLKEFAPKLALCTYHLPDDPEVMEALIKEANPNYKVVHIRKKLFAATK
jgi:FkbM family methyltransferase